MYNLRKVLKDFMNIIGYIKNIGDKSFKEHPFNDVDALILSELSYISFKPRKSLYPLKHINPNSLTKGLFKEGVDANYNRRMLVAMIKSKRFGDLIIQDIYSDFSHSKALQFYALTVRLDKDTYFISYRGTDTSLTGWKEDFILTINDTIPSQLLALSYLKRQLKQYEGNFYIGGHSKGGNLAFYAAMNIPKILTKKIISVYSFDGPGFATDFKAFKSYELIKDKMYKYLTYNDMVGNVFSDITPHKIVNSTGILLGGHDPFFWQISPKRGEFITKKDISKFSKSFDLKLKKFLEKLSMSDRTLFIKMFFEIFKKRLTIYDVARYGFTDLIRYKATLINYHESDKKRMNEILKMGIRIFLLKPKD